DFYPVSRFKEQFYRPDVIDAIFETYNEEQAITLADSRSTKKIIAQAQEIRQKLPPTVIISSPANGTTISNNTVSITYSVNSPIDAPAKNLRVLINGRPAATERGLKPIAATEQKIIVTVPSQDCTITLLAENDNGISPEANLYLKWAAPAIVKDEFIYKPKLYVLAIGVSDYNKSELKLGFAAKDAGDFASTMALQKGALYSDVVLKKLINKDATKDAITDGLEWIQKQTSQKDLAMIYFGGHGLNDNNGIFYMLPVGADIDRIRTTCLNFEELKQTVSNIAGKVVVFIDACHSGNVMGSTRKGNIDINAIVNELSSTENGAITFTSSTGKEFSLEDPKWGNGAFTKAVIEGLTGKAAIPGKNKITIKSLDAYISERVKELTGGKQHPTSVTPPNVPDFPIGVVK
ncbi:MAG: caspase family protein, partial [Chitinophagaceae bacterium]